MPIIGLPIPPDWERSIPVAASALREATVMSPRASDVHLREACPPWHRQGGTFQPMIGPARVDAREMEAVFAWVGGCPRNDWTAGDNTTSTVTDMSGLRWRATAYNGVDGLGAAFRRMPDTVPSLDQLGLPGEVRRLTAQSSGLVIAAGPARSGRTTTLASMLGLINSTRDAHILTIEHPVEYLHEPKLSLVSQRDVAPEDRNAALVAALHSDPDVVLVGEAVTPADFELCLTLAVAGYLVLTTVHAFDSVGACERIIAASVEEPSLQLLLGQTLRGVVAQRLVPDAADPRGCHAVAEVLMMSSPLRPLLRPGGDADSLRRHLRNQQASLDHALASKCRRGEITEDDARGHSVDIDAFDDLLHQAIMF